MPPVTCPKCGATFEVPGNAPEGLKYAVVDHWRNGRFGAAMDLLIKELTLDVRSAKAIIYHLPRTPGKCHRCKRAIDSQEVTCCSNCRSINLNWSSDDAA